MEREVGGGIGMGNTCKPMAVLFQCMSKFTANKKKKKKRKVPLPLMACYYQVHRKASLLAKQQVQAQTGTDSRGQAYTHKPGRQLRETTPVHRHLGVKAGKLTMHVPHNRSAGHK